MMAQFVTAFDDIVIKRYNVNRKVEDRIAVRSVYSPKQRVLFDIVNIAQTMTLPVVAITIGGISRDNSRVFNKLDGSNYTQGSNKNATHLKAPVPVNIAVNMSIITRFQTDMDQILDNFIPYSNPYVVISWKVPDAFALPNLQEIRCEVLWNGSVDMQYPVDITGQEKARIIADTSFTIKGWIFKEIADPYSNIYYVDYSLSPENILTSFELLSGEY
jgi:T4-like virus Myoviridae tail sheath stabiliser